MSLLNKVKSLLLLLAFSVLTMSTGLAALKLGQIRAGERGWVDRDRSESEAVPAEEPIAKEPAFEVDTSYEEEVVDAGELSNEIAPFHVSYQDKPEKKRMRIFRNREAGKRKHGLILIGSLRDREPTLKDGYLAIDVPPALRFSDEDPADSRPLSPALPEFNFVSSEYLPYLIEEDLSEEEMADHSMLSELVIELEPHETVSGVIDTRRNTQEELVEHFDLEEQRTTVLRPEEVLIFFETDSTGAGSAGALVPFSPATPSSTPTINSSATLSKE